jgi:hypothetical protein
MNDCSQTKTLLMLAADGELDAEQIAGLEQHVESCAACHLEQVRFRELNQDLGIYGDLLVRQNPPRMIRLVAPPTKVRAAIFRMPLAIALAASLLLGAFLIHRQSPVHPNVVTDQAFVPIPYVQPLYPDETATVMRMDVQVASLIAIGYKVGMIDPTAVVKADMLVGEDGRVHAVRLLSGLVLN